MTQPPTRKAQRLDTIRVAQANVLQRELLEPAPDQPPALVPPPAAKPARKPRAKAAKPASNLRKRPPGDNQVDFLAPALYDVSAKDNRSVMDVAVYRLSKRDKRANAVIRYDLQDGYVEVSSGAYGMASVWDYDIVLMAISHMTEAMNRYRAGKGEKPPETFRPHVADILQFCRREDGGAQKDAIVGALQRLNSTHITTERIDPQTGGSLTLTGTLIQESKIISTKAKKVEYVEFRLAGWMYEEITQGVRPEVLTVHPDYFLIDPALGRFLYRLARKAAGKGSATWGFSTLFKRSGSTGTQKEFNRMLREIISANDLPEYHLEENDGQMGPMLKMVHRAAMDNLKDITPNTLPGTLEDE